MKRPQLSQPIAGAANPDFFFRQGSSGAKTGSYKTDSPNRRMFLSRLPFFPDRFLLRRRRYPNKKRPQPGGRTLGPSFPMRHAEGRGACINVGCQGPFPEPGVTRVVRPGVCRPEILVRRAALDQQDREARRRGRNHQVKIDPSPPNRRSRRLPDADPTKRRD